MTTTLPCVEGESLPQYIARTGKLPPMQALALVGQLLAALDRAHRRGLAHTGFGADDLVVMANGRLALVGWAIAHREGPRLQAAAQDDVATAARIGYELIARGRLPAASPAGSEAWFPPSHAGLPVALDGVFERALSAEPHDAYPSAAAFWQALLDAMGTPVWDRPAKPAAVKPAAAMPVARAADPVTAAAVTAPKRRAPLAAVAAVAMLLAFAVGAIGWKLWSPPRGPVAATAAPPPVDSHAALQPRAAGEPREEVIAGNAAAIEPRDPAPQGIAPREADALRSAQPPSGDVEPPDTGSPPPARPARLAAAREPATPRTAAAAPATTAREPRETRVASARAPVRARTVAQRFDPDLGCDQAFFITREVCKVSKCETDAYSRHPVCRAMRDEQRRRTLLAEQALRTR